MATSALPRISTSGSSAPLSTQPGFTYAALADFGAALDAVTPQDFEDPRTVFQIGVTARRIDVVCSATGVEFGPAWERRETLQLDELPVPVIGLEDIIQNKRSTGRLQDAADVEALERLRQCP